MTKYETVIGLEVHAQLNTKSKMYCGCSTNFGDEPNKNICPVCTAQPGALPMVNKGAIEMAIKTGLALNCTINEKSVFARKNYFYPDLPKGYQISQFEFPLCTGGEVEIKHEGKVKTVKLTRIHLEEDAGKSMHDSHFENTSLVDFNRCGTPLIEIVSEPDMRSPEEAGDYLRSLRNVLVYLGVCEGNLQEGNFRCDANVSIRLIGSEKLGTRSEMKNLNSFKAVERAIAFEVERHKKILEDGGKVVQETRLWNDAAGKTESMRGKEEAHDYRYFPDPDLLPLVVDKSWIENVKKTIPELAHQRSARFISSYGIAEDSADILTDDKHLADYFEQVIEAGANPKKASNWILSELLRELKDCDHTIEQCKIKPNELAALIKMIDDGIISGKIAKEVFIDMFKSGESAQKIVSAKGLSQMSDTGELEAIIEKVLTDNAAQVAQYRSGKVAVLGFLVGQLMKATKGKANPALANELLKKKLG